MRLRLGPGHDRRTPVACALLAAGAASAADLRRTMLMGGPATMREHHDRLSEPKKGAVSPGTTAAVAAAVKVTTDFSIAAIMNAAAHTDAQVAKRKLSAPYAFEDVISGE